MQSLPLYELLITLRRFDFPLGINDYLTALHALHSEIDVGSRQQLIFVCQILWGKSAEEQELIAEILDKLLPDPLTNEQIQQLLQPKSEQPKPDRPTRDPEEIQQWRKIEHDQPKSDGQVQKPL